MKTNNIGWCDETINPSWAAPNAAPAAITVMPSGSPPGWR